MLTITRKVEFDAGHRIPNHDSKCRNLHGHRYVLECTVTGQVNDRPGDSSEGMVVDFGVLKALMLELVAEPWDHAMLAWKDDLNTVRALQYLPEGHKTVWLDTIPTVENLALLAWGLLDAPLRKKGLQLTALRLYETPNCWADVTA